jgi:hypothetical protein
MKIILCAFVLLGFGAQVKAAELTPETIIGHYRVSANIAFHKVYLKFHVVDADSFEIQRVYPNGKEEEVCNGTYGMNTKTAGNMAVLATSGVFKGVFTCPSNRQKRVDFDIDFKNKTTEDLINGTMVTVTSSLTRGYTINAFVKKQ